eukprot:2802462-Prymnesium_polylepis.1
MPSTMPSTVPSTEHVEAPGLLVARPTRRRVLDAAVAPPPPADCSTPMSTSMLLHGEWRWWWRPTPE